MHGVRRARSYRRGGVGLGRDPVARIAATEQTALDELDAAIASLDGKGGATPHLAKALASLRSAQSALIAGQ